jgi:hypothetical protein
MVICFCQVLANASVNGGGEKEVEPHDHHRQPGYVVPGPKGQGKQEHQ